MTCTIAFERTRFVKMMRCEKKVAADHFQPENSAQVESFLSCR